MNRHTRGQSWRYAVFGLVVATSGLVIGSCAERAAPAAHQVAPRASEARLDRGANGAEWSGGKITYGEVADAAAAEGERLRAAQARAQFELERSTLRELLDERLLEHGARAAGKSKEAFLNELYAEVTVSADEVASYRAQLAEAEEDGDASAEEATEQLLEQKRARARRALVDALAARTRAQMSLEAPAHAAAELDLGGRPAKGATSPVLTIVVFEDLECPFCAQAHEELDALLERHPNDIRVHVLHYPLELHDAAMPAAMAAECAHRQGKFWQMRARLYGHQDNLVGLRAHAEAVGLDGDAFDRCMASPETRERVEEDIDQAEEAGVDGTPAVFVNGIPANGVPSLADVRLQLRARRP